jgi:hypothetical protein
MHIDEWMNLDLGIIVALWANGTSTGGKPLSAAMTVHQVPNPRFKVFKFVLGIAPIAASLRLLGK